MSIAGTNDLCMSEKRGTGWDAESRSRHGLLDADTEQTERWGPLPSAAAIRAAHQPEDPRDITIRTLKAEVVRLADAIPGLVAGYHLNDPARTEARFHVAGARALLARLAVFAFLALLYLPAFAAPTAHRHVTKPLSAITVKVVAHQDFTRKLASRPGAEAPGTPWIITSHDIDSCVAWVDTTAGNVPAAEIGAFRACRTAIDLAADTAHAAGEKGGAR